MVEKDLSSRAFMATEEVRVLKKIFRRQSRESTSTHYYTTKERVRRDVESTRGWWGCPSGGEGQGVRPRPKVTATPTADNLTAKARVERRRAVGARCTWRTRLARRCGWHRDRVARQAVRKLQVPERPWPSLAVKMQTEERRARLKRAAWQTTFGLSRSSSMIRA